MFVRFSLTLSILAAYALITAQATPNGIYRGAAWSVNGHRALIWDGSPYVPVGWRIPGNADMVRRAVDTGVRDLMLDVRMDTDWTEPLAAAEQASARYLISVASPAPRAPAFLIQPASYRIERVPRSAQLQIPVPHAGSVFYVLIPDAGNEVARKGWADAIGGVVTIHVDETVASSEGFLLVLYPRVTTSDLTDYWEGFDKARDGLLARLRSAPLGPGLRGIVNPLGPVEMWASPEGGYVPDSSLFRLEFENYLRSKYPDTVALERAWRVLSPDIRSFSTAAQLIPLFLRGRGVDRLYDPVNDILIPAERTGAYWRDVQTVIENAAARRASRLTASIRQVADVPVVYEWSGWSPAYDSVRRAGVGLGMRAIGIGMEPIENAAAEAAATAIAWNTPLWLLATEVAAGAEPFGDERYLRGSLADTSELGAKGWFVRWTDGSEGPWMQALASEAAADSSVANRSSRAVFYPHNARYPATTMRLPGGVWWLPTHAAGNRLEVGRDYEAYRLSSPLGTFTAIWRLGAPALIKLRFAEPAMVRVVRFDGSPMPTRLLRDGIEVAIDNMPLLILDTAEIPIPDDAINLLRADYQTLTAEAKRLGIEVGDQRFVFEDSLRALSRNPGAAFEKMAESVREVQLKLAPFIWREGFRATQTNFGEIVESTSSVSGRVLAVDHKLAPPEGGFFATYRVRMDVTDENLDVWLAAHVPEAVRQFVSVKIGDSVLQLPDTPQAGYGEGFAWYNLGNVRLRRGSYDVTVRLTTGAPRMKMALDGLLLSPLPFSPIGSRLPDYVPGVNTSPR